ncbi:MAG: hypothetical protein LBN35_03990 [Clostridiales Family XIII bacterium]|nr:hypothetical protein [Clostridiales Family XIII bacterium]
MEKKYANLFKELKLKDGPEGLYPYKQFFMEAEDMEGFNAVFSYGVVKEPCVCHPVEGAVVHPYNEVLVFAGIDPNDILYFGAEVSIELGEEREEYIFAEPTVVTIPAGLVHGPVKFRRVTVPVAHYTVGLAPEYQADAVRLDESTPKSLGTKYAHHVKKLICHIDDEIIGTGMGYEDCTDERGVMKSSLAPHGMLGPGNSDELIWMFGKDLEGFDVNLTWGHYSQPGKWHRAGEIHTHPEEEILIFLGSDPEDPDYLGCEVELGMGYEAERNIVKVPTVAVCPKGFPHLPILTRWCDRPYEFVVVCLSGEHGSPWEVEQQ